MTTSQSAHTLPQRKFNVTAREFAPRERRTTRMICVTGVSPDSNASALRQIFQFGGIGEIQSIHLFRPDNLAYIECVLYPQTKRIDASVLY